MDILLKTNDDVNIKDLGLNLTHPKNNINLTNLFTLEEIKRSEDLQIAMENEIVVATYNSYVIKNIKYPNIDPELRISRYIKGLTNAHFSDFDFTLILNIIETKYEFGRKCTRYYEHKDQPGTLCVKKTYTDIIGERNINGTIVDNLLLGIEIEFFWYKNDGKISDKTKTIQVMFNREEAGEYLSKRRTRNINTLKGVAIGTRAEQYIDQLVQHYKESMSLYIETGSSDFLDSVTNETDPTIITILDTEIPHDRYNTVTIRQMILAALS